MNSRLNHIICLLLLSLSSLWGQINFQAKVNRSTVSPGERFTIEFSVNERGDDFRAPDFSGFKVVSGPNTSMSTYMDNSGVRMQVAYSYYLIAREAGEYTIGPAFIKVDGQTYRTESVKVTVSPLSQQEREARRKAREEYVSIRPLVSKTKVYQGEPFYARYRLYFRTEIGQPNLTEEPDFNAFYREEIQQEKINSVQEEYQGRTYTAADIRKMVLIPQRSGKLDPGNLELEVRAGIPTGRRDVFGRPYLNTKDLTLNERFPQIEVLPLPRKGRPSNFSGAVGQFSFKASLSKNELTTDESTVLRLELEGEGNIKLAEMPSLVFPDAFEVFDPERKESVRVGSFGMKGSKTVEYLLVPRYAGTYKIGPLAFSYFDTKTEAYRTVKIPAFEVQVEGGSVSVNQGEKPPVGGGEKAAVDFIGRDILFIKTSADEWRLKNQRFLGSSLFWTILILLCLGILGLLAQTFYRVKQGRNPGGLKQQKAGKVARKRLAQARKALKKQEDDTFYAALAAGLWGYFEDKLNLDRSALSVEQVRQLLKQRALDAELIDRITTLLERAEMARYTKVGGASASEDYRQTADTLTEIDKQL